MNKDVEALVEIRESREDDRNFILATWLRGLYYGNSWFKEIPKDRFMSFYHGVIMMILKRKSTVVLCAVLKEDPDVILGYSVLEKNEKMALHWVFVKEAWRRIGIGKQLVPKDIESVTHLTTIGKKLKPANVSFDPFLI